MKPLQIVKAWIISFFTNVHNTIVIILEWIHIWAKKILSITWKLALLILVLDIFFKTKSALLTFIGDIGKSLLTVSIGGAIVIAIIALVTGSIIVVFIHKKI